MRVLVVGGAGYIGSHTCKALAESGHQPIVFDNLHTGHEWAVMWGPLVRGDINDGAALLTAMRRYQPEAVINFAALTYVGESSREPTNYYRTNVGGVVGLLDAMRSTGISRVVFSSSCATYGIPPALPIVETTPQNPISPYGRSKRMGEEILRDACAAHGLGAIALRYFNAAGADAHGEIGEAHLPETHLIPLVLMAAAGLRPSISIFGTDYDTPDGSCIRDYVHVQDLAAAHVTALSACRPGEFTAYNLGQGNGSSIREVIDYAQRITNRSINAIVEQRRAGDPPRLVADAALAKANLAWTPVHSSLENVIQTAWKWMTESGGRSVKTATCPTH